MDLLQDTKFHLIVIILLISYINLFKPAFLNLISDYYQNSIIIFIILFGFTYRALDKLDYAIFVALLISFTLKCLNKHTEHFTTDAFKINFSNSEPLILSEGVYENDTSKGIPARLLENMQNITSFEIDDKYIVILTKSNFKSIIIRGTTYNENPFEGVKKIEIQKQY